MSQTILKNNITYPNQWKLNILDYRNESLFLSKDKMNLIDEWIKPIGEFLEMTPIDKTVVFSFYGKDSLIQKKLAFYAANKLKRHVICESMQDLLDIENNNNLINKEINEYPLALYVDKAGKFFLDDELQTEHSHYLHILSGISPILFLSSNKRIKPFHYNQYLWLEVECGLPDQETRKKMWLHYLGRDSHLVNPENLNVIINQTKLYESEIKNIIEIANNNCFPYSQNKKEYFEKAIIEASKEISQSSLLELTVQVKSSYRIEDLVLHTRIKELLLESLQYIKNRHIAFKACAMDKSPYGKGVNILFAGPSGTGKTMAASVTANEIGLPVYKVNMSSIVSKWHGETEKNINKIFDAAKNTNAVLFFDEADSLFNKRGDSRMNEPRNNNMAIGLLLQKMEEHNGICILATNLYDNMDPAFKRRFSYIIDFLLPGKEQRLQLWKKAFPDPSILSEDIDFEGLAANYEFGGANIASLALKSVCYAVDDGGKVTMKHISHACRRDREANR